LYVPFAQVEHELTLDEDEYNPGTQRVQMVAPALVPVFVMDPGSQVTHDVAPALVPVFVTEPGSHFSQEASPGDP